MKSYNKFTYRYIIAALAAVLALAVCMIPFTAAYAAGNFYIKDYDIRMVVNEDDTYQITETLQVEFTAPSHGIYRSIPRFTRLDRDGQLSQYNASVRDFEMLSGQPFEEDSDSKDFSYKIGDPARYADTSTTYQYSYLYDTGGDHFKDGDEVYHNMVGTSWEAQSIDHVTFEVVFPEDIDMSKVGVKTGGDVSVPFEAVDARTIRGETSENVLRGLTVRAVLPQGYFTREARDPAIVFYILIGILALAAAAGLLLWKRYGRDPDYPVTPEFYPPEDLSAPELAYLSKGEVYKNDVVSMLLSLADRGYLRIREYEEEVVSRRKTKTVTKYEISQLRDYDEDIVGERTFMEGLFEGGARPVVTMDELEDEFYTTIEAIEKEIKAKYKGMLYDAVAAKYSRYMYIAGLVGVAALLIVSRLTGVGFGGGLLDNLVGILALVVAPLFAFSYGFYLIAKAVRDGKKPAGYLIGVIIAGIGFYMAKSTNSFYGWQTIPFIIGLVLCLALFIIAGLCEKKTEYYAQIKARIDGYSDFLKTAEKDQLETLAEQDPGYYYRNLAFAFALGITSVYAQRFAAMARQAPDWYDSYTPFDSHDTTRMTDSINDMMSSMSSSMSSSPSDGSDGGSFSGGGGGGGGGGGSW